MLANKRIDKKIITTSSILLVLGLLIILLPFNALINTFFTEKLGIQALSFWKEGVFLLGLLLGLIAGGLRKWDKNLWMGFGFVFCLLVFGYSLGLGFGMNALRVLRLELLPIVAVIGFMGLGKILNFEQRNKVTKWLLFGGIFGVLSGAIFFALFGGEGLVMFGYRMDWSTFYTNEALAFCQRIENSEICRFQGFLSGPNQMGVYIVLLAAVTLKFFSDKKHLFWRYGLLILLFGLCVITFSRSSVLAFVTMLITYFGLEYKDHFIRYWKKIASGVVALCGLFGLAFWRQIFAFFDRPESNSERLRLMNEGLEFWFDSFIFGNGAGSIGPASRFVTENYIIPENWFIQVGGQFGLVGLIVFLAWYVGLAWKLYEKKSYAGVSLMVGLLIPLNLLHTFESATFVYALGIFLGLELNKVED